MDDNAQTTDPTTGDQQAPDDSQQNPGVPPVFSEEAASVGSSDQGSGGLTQEPFPVAEGSEESAGASDNGETSDAPEAPGPAYADDSTPPEQV